MTARPHGYGPLWVGICLGVALPGGIWVWAAVVGCAL